MNHLPEPPRQRPWPRSLPLHLACGWILVIAVLALVGFHVPASEKKIGPSYLIFYFHFPSAINCMTLFCLSGFISCWYLIKPSWRWDFWAASAVEVGVLACTITLVTGSLWGKAAWGLWWDLSDPRLMTVAIMWLTYLGYLALRSTLEEPGKRALFSAVFGAIGLVNIPLVWFAVEWFGQAHHPNPMIMEMEPVMKSTARFGWIAFFVLYTALWRLRCRHATCEHETQALREALARAGI